ncbi:hypothetical protein H2248_011460 [Termitomyces sp. 'cryptogamus']|nr:hypothetical protein H2248_011460 [Termitomyces sp. 'cryptogamus']
MGRRRIQCSHDYEERIQAAIRGVTEGQYKSYAEAALDLKIVTSDSRGTPNYGGGIVPSVGVKIRKHPRPYVVRSHHCETWEPAALT